MIMIRNHRSLNHTKIWFLITIIGGFSLILCSTIPKGKSPRIIRIFRWRTSGTRVFLALFGGIPAYGRGWKLKSNSNPGINVPTDGACAKGTSTGGAMGWLVATSFPGTEGIWFVSTVHITNF
jgi:hypothetical protein